MIETVVVICAASYLVSVVVIVWCGLKGTKLVADELDEYDHGRQVSDKGPPCR